MNRLSIVLFCSLVALSQPSVSAAQRTLNQANNNQAPAQTTPTDQITELLACLRSNDQLPAEMEDYLTYTVTLQIVDQLLADRLNTMTCNTLCESLTHILNQLPELNFSNIRYTIPSQEFSYDFGRLLGHHLNKRYDHKTIVRILFEAAGDNAQQLIIKPDSDDNTTLHSVAFNRHNDIIQIFLNTLVTILEQLIMIRNNPDITLQQLIMMQNNPGIRTLNQAIQKNQTEIGNLLRKYMPSDQ